MNAQELLPTIRQEIERRIKELDNDKYINLDAKACRVSELGFLKRFLDTLAVDAPEGLDEAAEELADEHGFIKNPDCKPAKYSWQAVRDVFIEAAKAGAEWAFGQMKEGAK